jgi:hypothetical protein
MNHEKLALLETWIRNREEARRNKEAGLPRPWTADPIINQFHFCNVRREDDRVTKELRALGLTNHEEHLPEFYTMARMFNHAPSVKFVLDHGWDEATEHFREEMLAGRKVYHTAYVVSTAGASVDKSEYIRGVVEAVGYTTVPATSLRAAHSALMGINGLGSFLAGQVVADLKNDRYLADAEDWWTWSCIGPGSKKGLDLLFGGGTTARNYSERMCVLNSALSADISAMRLHMQDLQNCLCEFSKYDNYLSGNGGRRRIYHVEH